MDIITIEDSINGYITIDLYDLVDVFYYRGEIPIAETVYPTVEVAVLKDNSRVGIITNKHKSKYLVKCIGDQIYKYPDHMIGWVDNIENTIDIVALLKHSGTELTCENLNHMLTKVIKSINNLKDKIEREAREINNLYNRPIIVLPTKYMDVEVCHTLYELKIPDDTYYSGYRYELSILLEENSKYKNSKETYNIYGVVRAVPVDMGRYNYKVDELITVNNSKNIDVTEIELNPDEIRWEKELLEQYKRVKDKG